MTTLRDKEPDKRAQVSSFIRIVDGTDEEHFGAGKYESKANAYRHYRAITPTGVSSVTVPVTGFSSPVRLLIHNSDATNPVTVDWGTPQVDKNIPAGSVESWVIDDITVGISVTGTPNAVTFDLYLWSE